MESRNRVQEIMCFFCHLLLCCLVRLSVHVGVILSLTYQQVHIVCADGATWPSSLVHEPTKSAARHPGHLTKAQLLPDDVGTGSSARW